MLVPTIYNIHVIIYYVCARAVGMSIIFIALVYVDGADRKRRRRSGRVGSSV